MAPPDPACKELVEVITDYLDGTLPPAERARIEAHLAGRRGCRAYPSQMRQTIRIAGSLRDQPDEPVPEESKQRVLDVSRAWKGA